MRGWLVPERAATEATIAGSRADAQVQVEVATAVAQLIGEELARYVSWHIVDRLLVWNFGEWARGAVWIQQAPLLDAQKAFVRSLIAQILTQPANADMFFGLLDVDAMLDQVELPKLQTVATQPQPPTSADQDRQPDSGQNTATLSRIYRNYLRALRG